MKQKLSLSTADKLVVAGLVTATAGVVIQIASGVPYPKVPPVFFILLIPTGLIVFGRWRWTPIVIILAGLFLIMGLFSSGASVRLFNLNNFGGCIGLWIQMLGVVVATITSIIVAAKNYMVPTS
jgi:hypothetical protein